MGRAVDRAVRSVDILNLWGRCLSAASKLTAYDPDEVADALSFMRSANPELVQWLYAALSPAAGEARSNASVSTVNDAEKPDA